MCSLWVHVLSCSRDIWLSNPTHLLLLAEYIAEPPRRVKCPFIEQAIYFADVLILTEHCVNPKAHMEKMPGDFTGMGEKMQ